MRWIFAAAFVSTVALLAACQPAPPPAEPAPPPPPAATGPQPPEALASSFPGCTWGEVKGGGASIYAFTCPDKKIVFDAALPGFKREMTGEMAGSYPVVWLFTKAADAPIEAALPAIKAASKGAEKCALEPIKDGQAGDFQLMPTGAARKAYDAFIAGKADGPSMPCGDFGPSEGGMRIISVLPGAPTLVAVAETGTDVPMYDLSTLKGAP